MPINRKHSLAELLAVLRDYPLPHRKRITFEYILIAGVNDALQDANKLVDLLRPLRCKINLIPFNEHPGVTFKRPEKKKIAAFRDLLVSHGYTAIVRESRQIGGLGRGCSPPIDVRRLLACLGLELEYCTGRQDRTA